MMLIKRLNFKKKRRERIFLINHRRIVNMAFGQTMYIGILYVSVHMFNFRLYGSVACVV